MVVPGAGEELALVVETGERGRGRLCGLREGEWRGGREGRGEEEGEGRAAL